MGELIEVAVESNKISAIFFDEEMSKRIEDSAKEELFIDKIRAKVDDFKHIMFKFDRMFEYGELVNDKSKFELVLLEAKNIIKIADKHKLPISNTLKHLFAESQLEDSPQGQEKKLKNNQHDKIICQALAQLLWQEKIPLSQELQNEVSTDAKDTSGLKIAHMIKHPWIKKYGNAGQYKDSTIHAWIKDIAPEAYRKPGRIPKQKP